MNKMTSSCLVLLLLFDVTCCVDVLGGRTTPKEEGVGASSVVSILIPTLLGVAILIFCVVCYYRKQKEKTQNAHIVRAEERLKENADPHRQNYQNSGNYVYNRSQMRLPSYEGYTSQAFVPDFQVDLEPPPYSPTYANKLPARIHSTHPRQPPMYAPEFEPLPPRIASRYSANSFNQFPEGDNLSIQSQYEDEYSARSSSYPARYGSRRYEKQEFDNISLQSADDFHNRLKANDVRLCTRSRDSSLQRRRGTPVLPHRTVSGHSGGSFRNFDNQSIISDTNSLNSGLSRSRSFLQMRPMTHEKHVPIHRTASARSHDSNMSHGSHGRHGHHRHHRRRFHHHRNSLKLPSSALQRSKSFHDHRHRKSVRFAGRDYDSDGYESVSILGHSGATVPKFYRTSSMPTIAHRY